MSATAAGLGFFGLLVGLTLLTWRRGEGASPRVAAGAYLVSLFGWALLPALWLGCLDSALVSWVDRASTSKGGCLLGLAPGQWQLLGYVPAALVLGVVLWHGLRHATAARHAEVRGTALSSSVRRPTSAGAVWVVPSGRPAAFASGLWRCRAVVTSGMLALLEGPERQAVCEHEAAHVRLGHPRLLVLCGAVAAAYGRFPPVSRAWDGLRREFEAAADDEAARVVGTEVVLSCLAKVAMLTGREPSGGAAAAFGDAAHLRWRAARLGRAGSPAPWPTALVGSALAVAATAMAFVGCVFAGAPTSLVGTAACLVVVGSVALRPTWAWGRHSAPA